MSNLVQETAGKNVIASGLPGTVFQAAVENRGVFTDSTIKMAGAMYICTGNTLSLKDGEYSVPEVIAVSGPKDPNTGNYKISITFNNGKVTSAQLIPE